VATEIHYSLASFMVWLNGKYSLTTGKNILSENA